ncbi:kinase-like domain-containing protein [Rhizophagus irregularis DAOM 181602=DAOM 197198]|uniref:Ypk1p n=1 Tax=Rhizophagus irregularis (strain DAOM 197198w) TaxID=1432141 RepID=A0A015I730_RHIIW|nr:Ypk1p [Rhizophagus irregularis DAOM 197198w]GET51348.1 kinase-like domain-containing protein [Rhizophagus irregularis DAOM 181602=DAOM 197198]
MDEIKLLSDDVIEQIKDFDYWYRTKEQKSLIDKLITDKELKERYEIYGLCKECKQLNTEHFYCWSCKSQYFKQNFKNWTSGNHDVDEFIQKAQLKAKNFDQIIEWIEYDEFEDVEYLAKGGFGTTFKAIWKDGPWKLNFGNNQLERDGEIKVALKCLHNSQSITADFLKEVESNILVYKTSWVVRCFGITKDLKTNNFMMVMELKHCDLRQHLNNNFNTLNWKDNDFNEVNFAYITDLGLCQPANVESDNKKIYGVLPYVAPEVLRGGKYTQASDIYAFGIVAYEICTGFPPYHDMAHDELLAMKICQGLRPKSNYKIPQLIIDKINQCWDADPSIRPKTYVLFKLLDGLYFDISENKVDSVIYGQVKEADEINKKSSSSSTVQLQLSFTSTLSYITHPQAIYTSRLLDFKNLPELNNADNNDDLLGVKYSDFTKLDINSKGNYFIMW